MSSSRAPMKTEISRFCQDYSEIILPLRSELGQGIDFIRDQKDNDELKEPLSGLCDVHHRLKNLADKVASQQAYVIIFGPLKSGKSTLMNAFSAAYVSEVTALPAYPCLVHVKHEDNTNIVASRFNGHTEKFRDFQQMQEAIGVYHRELAEQIRRVEEQGETFDPGLHCPDAIRRLDIGLPAEPLKESYTILVDTPGLYSRMKFGYDLMSREFRDSAACAVFVVKTDNLFLEQVFQEFGDLLDLFSRIFLVVNIDANKCDLSPNGELRPSLESREPQRIVDAFCSLSMSAPLRKAYDEGRLKIYPIDLLHAATERLGEGETNETNDSYEESAWEIKENTDEQEAEYIEGEEEGAEEESETEENPDALVNQDDDFSSMESFNEFMSDMTSYLNSNDYLIHFMCDSLRQGRKLVREINECCDEQSLEAFLHSQASLELSYNQENSRRQALGRLNELNWDQTFAGMHQQIQDATADFVKNEKERLTSKLIQDVDQWFEEPESLSVLLSERIAPAVNNIPELVRTFVIEQLQSATDTPWIGADLSSATEQDLQKGGLSPANMKNKAINKAIQSGEKEKLPEDGINAKAMPVRRSFWDWILLRGMNRVREKLFGPDEAPDRPISIKVKQTRLGQKGRDAFCQALEDHIHKGFDSMAEMLSAGMTDTYIKSVTASIKKLLTNTSEDLDQKLPKLKKRIKTKKDIQQTLEKLAKKATTYDQEVENLENAFAHLHPEFEEETEETAGSEEELEASADNTIHEETAEAMEQENEEKGEGEEEEVVR